MCNCLSFLLENPSLQQKWAEWSRFLSLFGGRSESSPSAQGTLNEGCVNALSDVLPEERIAAVRGDGCVDGLLETYGIHVIRSLRRRKGNNKKPTYDQRSQENQEIECSDRHSGEMVKPDHKNKVLNNLSSQAMGIPQSKHRQNITPAVSQEELQRKLPRTIVTNGGDETFSLFMQQGLKGRNQDAMVVWENFLPSENATFCGVFDGHGLDGHHISKNVQKKLPAKIASCWRGLQASSLLARTSDSPEKGLSCFNGHLDPDSISIWEETFHNAFNLMDRDLLRDEDVDCVFSGSTAVVLVKQGNDIMLANLGDSRAVMGVKFGDSVVALQLTIDLNPNLPREADRIKRCKGRVLALRTEPFVKRVWLPHENSPGLAMTRAFGDYILKNFGVISVPEVTHRRISKNDKFIVLATDGVWDVLSNEQVVRIIDAAPARSFAAQAVVDTAVSAWKMKYPDAKVDDCAVVCMFLNSVQPESCLAANSKG